MIRRGGRDYESECGFDFSDSAVSSYGRRCRYFTSGSDPRRCPAGRKAANMKKQKKMSLQGLQAHYFDGPSGGRPAQKPSKTVG